MIVPVVGSRSSCLSPLLARSMVDLVMYLSYMHEFLDWDVIDVVHL
jgi:hypothetical protein